MVADSQKVHRDSVEYWKRVTQEHDAKHPTAKDDVFTRYFGRLEPAPGLRILDVGIGFGRFVPHYLNAGMTVSGIDVDPNMIAAVRADWTVDQVALHESAVERCPMADGSVDRIVCWGVFDELDQGPALAGMSRLLALGGRLLVTGKNTDYHADDAEAIAAEEGARAKNHPNHFTDLRSLDLSPFGLRMVSGRYFARRGDIVTDTGADAMPERFYEYILVLEKTGPLAFDVADAPSIASEVSRTYGALRTGE